ncbi:ArsR/SmtB family transcription factor [Alkalicoccobacillus porphyridii]|uniref:Helix-turn-helix transcriptional regulator n=1 Tax=Alkalicoccobacillus porphyridii TaxID=2597270 RepID=A0A554A1W6_9BACI|nr:metalloregulator ArsR/SmtB family transcription factor [Alkalicoccobacillus porphyridii]TSB47683.1 helix-turn-helix transcriptional regulator [Alkalicoccobacillus porphyridii]
MKTVKNHQDTCEVFSYDEQKVARVSNLVQDIDFVSVSDVFKALSDVTRLKIAYALLQEDELCVCDVANIIGMTTASTSHHLRHLRNLRIAKSRKEGKLVFYSLDDEHVRQLVTMAVEHSQEV